MTNTRVERFERNGYKTIHLFGHWYLVRNWSIKNPRWYARIPIYLLTYLPPRAGYVICDDDAPAVEIDPSKLRI